MSDESRPAIYATRLTPEGRGAVAVVSVEGANAIEYCNQHFVPAAGKPLSSFPLDRIIFGRWEQAGASGEEIVVCRTSATALEVNCHGGVAAARAIISALVADGAVEQPPELWATRHRGNAIEAEARLALAEARTERAAAILLDQYRGALRQTLDATIDELKRGESAQPRQRLTMLLERAGIGLHLTKPWRVAFAGSPNVGKSSLMNCLLGYGRSIVFDQPGTTRDLLTAPTAIDGWSLELIDTAGLCESGDAIEAEGVSRATSVLAEADLTVLVFDATCDWDTRQEQLLADYPQALAVVNKCDLCNTSSAAADFLATSALTGAGIAELMRQIAKRLVRRESVPGDPVPFTQRQTQAINMACRAVDAGQIPAAIEALINLVKGDEAATETKNPK